MKRSDQPKPGLAHLTVRGRIVVAVLWVAVTGVLGWYAMDMADWLWGR